MGKRRRKKKYRINALIFGVVVILILIFVLCKKKSFEYTPTKLELQNLPEGFESYGIDVSHHQGKIDWETFFAVNDTVISFVYCKATEGTDHTDREWNTNRKILKEKRISNGAYHFYLPHKDPRKQANHFLNVYSFDESDLPPVLDAEIDDKYTDQLIQGMKIWLTIVEENTGRRPIIYTSHHLYTTKFRNRFKGYKFWIARYSSNKNQMDDSQILHWQYSDKGRLSGITGYVDLNYSKVKFN